MLQVLREQVWKLHLELPKSAGHVTAQRKRARSRDGLRGHQAFRRQV